MELYYLILCMLLDLKSKEMRKIKVLRYEVKKASKPNKKDKILELKYQRCSIHLINIIIRNVKHVAKGLELDDFKGKEFEDDVEEG